MLQNWIESIYSFTTEVGGFGCDTGVGGCLTCSLGGDILSVVAVKAAISFDDWTDRVRPWKKKNKEVKYWIQLE